MQLFKGILWLSYFSNLVKLHLTVFGAKKFLNYIKTFILGDKPALEEIKKKKV